MPGIILPTVNTDQNEPIFYSNHFSLNILLSHKKKFAILFVIISLLLMIPWKPSSQKILSLPSTLIDFTGREKELHLLKNHLLKKRGTTSLIALCGEGGIGKTELAITFANRYLNDFSLIVWIDGSHPETINDSFLAMGEILNVHDFNINRLKEKILWKLENSKGKPWLLIFDDLTHLPQRLPRKGGAILVTTRDKSICSKDAILKLDKTPEQAHQLLSKLTQEQHSVAMEKLAKELSYLPLLINIVGRYIAETPGVTVSNYSTMLPRIIHSPLSPLKKSMPTERYPTSLENSYQLTLEFLEKKNSLIPQFLKDVIHLHPKNIPIEFLYAWLQKMGYKNSTQLTLIAGDILRELQNHSLIRYDFDEKTFSIHLLLKHTLMLNSQFEISASNTLSILTQLSPVHQYNPTQKETIRPFQKILPHCLALLEFSPSDTFASIRLALTVARYYTDTEWNFQKGEQYLSLAKEWSTEWEHPLRGRVHFLNGILKYRQKDYPQALHSFQQALSIYEKDFPEEFYQNIEQNPIKCSQEYQRAICKQFEAQLLRILGHLEGAEIGLNHALQLFRSLTHGKDHFDIARILREQGILLGEKGHLDEAITKIEEAITMQKRVYGKIFSNQPTVAATYRILGDLHLQKGHFTNADQAYKKAIEVSQLAYQTQIHPFIGELYQLRAIALSLQGKQTLSQELENKSKVITQKLNL